MMISGDAMRPRAHPARRLRALASAPAAARAPPRSLHPERRRRVAARAEPLDDAAGAAAAEELRAAALDLPFESDQDLMGPEAPLQKPGMGAPPLRPASLDPGTVVAGKYTIESQLGAGANAVTYRARVNATGEQVAIKAMSLRGLRDWKQLELFQREAVVLQGLAHPSIPRYLEYFEEDTASDRCFFIVQAEARGRSLEDMMRAGKRADEKEVLRISTELLSILKYLASLRPPVVHRDIKPANVVLEGGEWGGRVFLIDFGGVQGVAPGETFASTIVGSYGYMAPEQFSGAATPASDLYSLGATLLHLSSGLPPSAFPQERMRLAYKGKVTVGPALGELLDGLLEPLAEDRLTAQEAIDVATGKAAKRRKKAAAAQPARQSAGAPARVSAVQQLLRGIRKPAGTRVKVEASPSRLDIDIPPEGVNGNAVGTGLFAVAWNAFVAFWTFSALASGGVLFALFSAPFWFAGWQLAGQAFGGALMHERLAIGRSKFRLAQELAVLKDGAARFLGQGARAVEGEAADVSGARVVTTVVVNGVPRTAVELVAGVKKYRFGESLDRIEQEWIASEINGHLDARGAAPSAEAMAAADPPEVYADGDIGVTAGNKADPFWDMRQDSWDRDPFRDRERRF